MKKILLILFCFFGFPLLTHAIGQFDVVSEYSCPKKIVKYYTDEVDKINVSYSFAGYNNNAPLYNILVTNVNKKIKVLYSNGVVYPNSNNEVLIKTKKSGAYEILLDVYTIPGTGCYIYAKKTITLPNYNPFYSREECKGLSKYPVCTKWSDFKGNENDFKSAIEAAKKDLEKDKTVIEKSKVKQVKHWYNYVTTIFVKYWWAVILVLVLITGIFYAIRLKNKKNEYNFKL